MTEKQRGIRSSFDEAIAHRVVQVEMDRGLRPFEERFGPLLQAHP